MAAVFPAIIVLPMVNVPLLAMPPTENPPWLLAMVQLVAVTVPLLLIAPPPPADELHYY
jgi:hypothetical protein